MTWGKFLGCVAGGVVAVIAAPVLLPVAAAAGGAALAAGVAVGGAAAAAGGAAVAAVGGAGIVGAVGSATAAVGSAVAGSTIGAAAVGSAAAVGTAVGGIVTGTVATVGATGVAAALGASATYSALTAKEGFDSLASAKRLVLEAESLHATAKDHFEIVSQRTAKRLEALAIRRMEIFSEVIGPSIELIKRFKTVNESGVEYEDGHAVLASFTPAELEQASKMVGEATRVLSDIKAGASVMRAASGGTLGFMSQFGVASTGTAIGSLSGVAATNATLAALGGGALSVGGGGMALGSAVLGGVVIMPAAVTVAYRFAADAEKKLTEAHKHFASVLENAGKYRTAETALKGVDRRVRELKYAMTRLSDIYAGSVFPRLESVYANNKQRDGQVYCSSLSDENRLTLGLTLQVLRSIKQVIAARVLDENGFPSAESSEAIATAKAQTSTVSA